MSGIKLVSIGVKISSVYANVNPKTQFKNLKTPEKSKNLAFFFISNLQYSNNVNSM